MRKFLAMIFLAAPLMVPTLSSAQMREFAGELQKVKGKTIIVDNKKGDKITFTRDATSEVSGEKDKWEDLKKKDWVVVHSKMLEKPRKAYKVEVGELDDDEEEMDDHDHDDHGEKDDH